uniref:Uncharacterized protein n=1 Tax=Solanum lycopersicum TaxID=4081 RepID=K4BUL7_SOLLC
MLIGDLNGLFQLSEVSVSCIYLHK